MAVSVDEVTKVITIPLADLTLVSGNNYTYDTNQFHLDLREWEHTIEGSWRSITHSHSPEITLSGVVYSRFIEIINGYTVTFENGSYKVSLQGSNNNIVDVLNLNNVQVVANNSAGLATSGFSTIDGQRLLDIFTRLGLNPDDPFTDTPSQMSSQSGDIVVDLTGDGVNTTTQTRQ